MSRSKDAPDVRRASRTRRGAGSRGGIAFIVVLALACAALVAGVVVKTQNDAARTAREAAAYTPPPIASSSPGAGTPRVVAFVVDESGTRAATGVLASQRWPRLVADSLRAEVRTIAVNGGGYTVKGTRGSTFVDAAADVPTDADVVVFVGGSADIGAGALAVGRAATRAFAAAKDRAPDAVVVAVGPLFQPASASANELETVTTALASSARITGADWVDPLGAGWITGVDRVTDLGEQAETDIGSQMSAVLREVLA